MYQLTDTYTLGEARLPQGRSGARWNRHDGTLERADLADRPAKLPAHGINVLVLEEQELIRCGLLAITASIPEITATILAIDSACDAQLAEFDATLLSSSTLIGAERAGVNIEQLRPMIVIVSTTEPEQLELVTRWPANGYVMQDEVTAASLRIAVLRVASGQLVIPQAITSYLLHRVRCADSKPRPRLDYLSSRETEVLRLLVAGASNKEIAWKLGISVHGVKRHVSTLLSHFHSPNRVHLVSHVLQSGILPQPWRSNHG